MTHNRRHTEGLPDNANPNAVEALLRAEMVRMNVRFLRFGIDNSAVNIETIKAHVAQPAGGDATKGEDKHWRLSTLEFLVDDSGNITHYICARD